jgi:hypothetical protein
MQPYSGPERRRSSLAQWAFFVEIGVNYLRTVDRQRALAFMSAQGVSPEVIARVTAAAGRRRLTRWEMQVDEPALRSALGARPLLAASIAHDASCMRAA